LIASGFVINQLRVINIYTYNPLFESWIKTILFLIQFETFMVVPPKNETVYLIFVRIN